MRGCPGLLPGLGISIVVGFVISRRVVRALGVGRMLACALVRSATLILSAMLNSGGDVPQHGGMS